MKIKVNALQECVCENNMFELLKMHGMWLPYGLHCYSVRGNKEGLHAGKEKEATLIMNTHVETPTIGGGTSHALWY
jgi:hypothetical protein